MNGIYLGERLGSLQTRGSVCIELLQWLVLVEDLEPLDTFFLLYYVVRHLIYVNEIHSSSRHIVMFIIVKFHIFTVYIYCILVLMYTVFLIYRVRGDLCRH